MYNLTVARGGLKLKPIPGSEPALPRKRGAEHTLIDFIGETRQARKQRSGKRRS